MKRYLVGGAVRDALLGRAVTERDWVVVGATPDEMIAAGYKPVGRDFPVFLDPETKDETALARTERKSGRGYHGFVMDASPLVTLEEDLRRRDLTVNAMAQDEDGRIIDPYGGRRDLESRTLRHVSESFAEDPVRILRLARFHARYAARGFVVADETMTLMRSMVAAGEADHLVAERVWKETERAMLESEKPSVFFEDLEACGALARVMPEVAALRGVPQRADYHPEVDTLTHTLMCVDAAVRHDFGLAVRVSALLHDLGKAATPSPEWPSHRQHEERGLPLVAQFCERLRVPNQYRDLALAVTRDHLNVHRATELRPNTLLGLLDRLGAFKKSGEFFEQALQSCLCDARGRLGLEQSDYPAVDYLRAARAAALKIQAAEVMRDGHTGPAVSEQITLRREQALRQWKAGRLG
ncbi:MAG: multifunctional addition/repair protein [Hydrocarboniphaga sp.]|uniref:multifunctional CCA addition/repair protein n=1 Tax=Hydrocarboniphaga sp. TaxID=2033016 RepID=UPI00260F832A|nr:multifunctional CCA addition/repair protein [Hydrocarboniphaga sp.]MDB5968255.1 multifunctional addition/repair protein [Hydrocarboniphaga sp.]